MGWDSGGSGVGERLQSQAADSTAAGDSADAGKSDTAAEPGSKGTIGYTTMSLTNPFFKVIGDAMTAEAREHGYDVMVVSVTMMSASRPIRSTTYCQSVKAIVITPCDPRSIGAAIRKANEKGIPCSPTTRATMERTPKWCVTWPPTISLAASWPVRRWSLCWVSPVANHGDPQIGRAVLPVAGGRVTEVIDAHNAKDGAAQIEIVTTQEGKGAREAGYEVTKDAIVAHPDLVAAVCHQRSVRAGRTSCPRRSRQAGSGDHYRIRWGTGRQAGDRDGKILCDPIQFPDQMGRTTVQQIVAFFDGEDVPAEILIEPRLYYKKDADQDAALQDTAN